MAMDVTLLRPGHWIRITGGREAEVLEASEDGRSIKAVYLSGFQGPFGMLERTREIETIDGSAVEALLDAVPQAAWNGELNIVLHYIPVSDDGPAEYVAETLSGVPNGVKVQGGDPYSARGALEHLLGGLALMGFSGVVSVNDGSGREFQRYETQVPALV
jgi:hypothetical protein